MEPRRERDAVLADHEIRTGTIHFAAYDIRRQATGIHALVFIGWDEFDPTQPGGKVLESDLFNLHRREERTRLANAAWGLLPDIVRDSFPKNELSKALADFCSIVWPTWVASQTPSLVVGLEERIPPPYLLDPFIIRGAGTILFGDPGSLKSYSAMLMAISVDAGLLGFWRTQQARVLFVNLERSEESVQARLGSLNRTLYLPAERPLAIHNARGKTLADVRDPIQRYVQEEGIELVVVDSLSRAGSGDMTANDVANRSMDILNGIASTWVVIGHSPRGESTHVFGSQMFDAAADLIVSQTPEHQGERHGIALSMTKANDSRIAPTEFLEFEFDELGLISVSRPEKGKYGELVAYRPETRLQRIEAAMDELGKGSATEIAEHTGLHRSDVSEIIRKSDRFVKVEMIGRSVIYGRRYDV
jgi:hypothetical protein